MTPREPSVEAPMLLDNQNRPALDFYRRMAWQSTQLTCLRKSIVMKE
jgi:hypothetical protein